jgi:hypothetical protein
MEMCESPCGALQWPYTSFYLPSHCSDRTNTLQSSKRVTVGGFDLSDDRNRSGRRSSYNEHPTSTFLIICMFYYIIVYGDFTQRLHQVRNRLRDRSLIHKKYTHLWSGTLRPCPQIHVPCTAPNQSREQNSSSPPSSPTPRGPQQSEASTSLLDNPTVSNT